MMKPIAAERLNEILSKMDGIDPLLVIGDIGIDKYTYGDVKRISPEAPVPILEVSKEWLKLGLAANISHNLSDFGVDSTLCGVIGNDANASKFENLLEELELKSWGLVRDDQRTKILKERVVTSTQQICRIDYEYKGYVNESVCEKLQERVEDFSAEHSAVIIEDYAKGTLTEGFLTSSIPKFREAGKIVAVDPGRNVNPNFYKGATLLKPNLSEAMLMAKSLGHENVSVEECAKILLDKLELEQVIITMGGQGMLILERAGQETPLTIPTIPTQVFDVSGAGDTALSVVVSSLVAGATLEESAWIANCGSGVVVGKTGTATVNRDELLRFHARIQEKFKS
jgi:rfaE bifunctional protein kinase chain/domain